MWQQMLKFGLVGALATLVHMVIGYLMIQSGWHPLLANTIAFMIAFFVSFVGHLGFSFADQQTSFSGALWRFAIVGLIGFGCNQTILLNLIAFSAVSAAAGLVISTSFAATVTFILSRVWAFRAGEDGDVVVASRDVEVADNSFKDPLS